ncbi:ArsR/SmtB family transcription factor [Herbiconiux sp. P17]|uniref:ArsR/SmtB family transcription factor n=1 Tax=Herbiconiux wuyangfengii TaxID=3342794 RepID=UPI0035B9B60B
MVAQLMSETEADAVFHALADTTRRDIVRRAIRREQSISSLAERYTMSFAAVQKHVAVLERSTLVVKERRGKEQIVRANLDTLRRATRLLDEYETIWRDRVLRIDALLSEETPEPPDAPDAPRGRQAAEDPPETDPTGTER